jgi:outer membrane protein
MKRMFLLAPILWAAAAHADSFDAFRTDDRPPALPSTPMPRDTWCQPTPPDQLLELGDAVREAICAHPRARQAWASVRAQAEAVDVAKAAYLPKLDATAGIQRNTLSTTYDYSSVGLGSQRQSQNSTTKYAGLNLSWVLFDFGKRSAGLHQARALLAAANAEHGGALQAVFFNAAQAYYEVQSAQAAVDAAKQAERIANDSLASASAKHAAGAGTLGDQLQAQTQYRRAVLDRVSAEGDLYVAKGALAVAMGRDVNMPVKIAADTPVRNDATTAEGVDQLIKEAAAHNPKLLAARAKLDQARATVDAARAQGRPTLSLIGSYTYNDPSYQTQPESFPITRSRGSTIGLQLSIPLFEGFASSHRVEQAKAQADAQQAVLRDTELQVSLDVWKSYQELQAAMTNLQASGALLSGAQRSLDIARGRYKEGVGSFTELLNAQTAFVDARKQRVLAVSKWRTERLRLAASLGRLGMLDGQ